MPKIGILGGTFNPVHNGHIAIAKCVLQNTDIQQIVFLPTGNPHYKVSDTVADKSHRFNMLCIATHGMNNIEISDYEIKSTTPCYTVDTMRYFKSHNPQNEYCFIIGADSLDYIHKWKDAKNLIAENEFIVVNRNFKDNYNLDKNIEYILSVGGKVTKADMPMIDISSSMVRDMIKSGIDATQYIGKNVYEYIINNKLYIGESK